MSSLRSFEEAIDLIPCHSQSFEHGITHRTDRVKVTIVNTQLQFTWDKIDAAEQHLLMSSRDPIR